MLLWFPFAAAEMLDPKAKDKGEASDWAAANQNKATPPQPQNLPPPSSIQSYAQKQEEYNNDCISSKAATGGGHRWSLIVPQVFKIITFLCTNSFSYQYASKKNNSYKVLLWSIVCKKAFNFICSHLYRMHAFIEIVTLKYIYTYLCLCFSFFFSVPCVIVLSLDPCFKI